MEKEFKPRTFEDFADWIKSEIGEVTIKDLISLYKKITKVEVEIKETKTEEA